MIPTPNKIEILKAGTLDVWGDPTVSEIVQLDGSLRTESKVVTNNQGDEVISNFTLLFVGFVDVTLNGKFRFTEPNGVVVEKSPIQLKFMRDLGGSVAFTKVVL